MRIESVPQDAALLAEARAVSYAVREDGNYTLVPSAGWDPANIANEQAWQQIQDDIRRALAAIKERGKSPLLYHMARNQMTISLLASYSGFSRFRIWRHLSMKRFKTLPDSVLTCYANTFKISIAELCSVPDEIELPVSFSSLGEFND